MAKTIMIVDDEPDIRTYLMAVLEDNGFGTFCVEENESVVEAVEERRPDLVLLDIMMPRRSGVSVYRDLRTSPAIGRVPVALISGIERANSLFDGAFSGASGEDPLPPPDGFIEKPIQIRQLIDVVETLLAHQGDAVEPFDR